MTKEVLLLHDNAPVHKSRVVLAALHKSGFEIINHPPYSPELAPCNYYLFPNMKKELRGKKFSSDEEEKDAVSAYFEDKSEYFFSMVCIRLLNDLKILLR